jgi:hypothetical protein
MVPALNATDVLIDDVRDGRFQKGVEHCRGPEP